MQGRSFRGLTRIRLPNHRSDNSSLVLIFTCSYMEEALIMSCILVNEYVNELSLSAKESCIVLRRLKGNFTYYDDVRYS